jgi:hypothetical protein
MTSIDLKKTYRDHYTAKATPSIVDVPERPFLMIDGHGDPNTSQEYLDAIQTLYPIAYGLRAAVKTATGDAYTVMPLEGLWWVPDMAEFDPDDKSNWYWTAMICLPDVVTESMGREMIAAATEKKKLASGSKARIEAFAEGTAAQILHVGSYSDETDNIAKLHRFIADNGYSLTGKHHEIYLSDPRRTEEAKLRTVIRQPFTAG